MKPLRNYAVVALMRLAHDLCILSVLRAVILNQDASAPWGAWGSFQG